MLNLFIIKLCPVILASSFYVKAISKIKQISFAQNQRCDFKNVCINHEDLSGEICANKNIYITCNGVKASKHF